MEPARQPRKPLSTSLSLVHRSTQPQCSRGGTLYIGRLTPSQGGGYQYRLCPLSYNLTEECFQQTPVAFANNSKLMLGDGNIITLDSTFVDPHTDATLSIGEVGAWQMNPLPGYVKYVAPDGWAYDPARPRWFDPPCDDQNSLHPAGLSQGNCSGEWLTNITTYDYLRIPGHLEAGEYVLGFRCEYCSLLRCLVFAFGVVSPDSPNLAMNVLL